MDDQQKTKAQLIAEIAQLRRRVAELETIHGVSKQVDETLTDNQEEFEKLVESIPLAVGIFRNDEFLYANPKLSELTGYNLDELRNKGPFEVIHPDFREMSRSIGEARWKGEDVPSTYQVDRKSVV